MAIRSERAATAPEHRPTPSASTTQSTPRSSHQRSSRTSSRRRRLRAFVLAGTAAMMLASSSGCSLFSNAYKQIRKTEHLNDFMLAHRNKVFAAKAWYREKDCFRNRSHLAEFKAGFMQGYADIANGSDGCTPCVAPSQYWGWKYQSPGGQAAIDAWFAGYPLGVKAAEQDGVGHWRRGPVLSRHTAPPKPAEPGVAPHEAAFMLAPDGTPITDEIVVPGSTRIIETTTPATPQELEEIAPPAPSVTEPLLPGAELNAPAADAETMWQPSSNQPIEQTSATGSTMPAAELDQAIQQATNLIPRESAMTFSLNDSEADVDSVDEDAIEGIFDSIQMPTNLGGVVPQADASQAADNGSSDEIGSGDEIPFNFE